MAEGVKPSAKRVGRSGAYSNQRPRRLVRMSSREAVSRDRNFDGSGDGGGRKGWYRFSCCCCCFCCCGVFWGILGADDEEEMIVAEIMGLGLGLGLDRDRGLGGFKVSVEDSIIVVV